MAETEVLLENTMNWYGLRTAHIIRMGMKIDPSRWVAKLVTADAEEFVEAFANHEKELDVWHLRLVWNAREVIKIEGEQVGVWWIGSQRVSWAIDMAATMYRLSVGQWPEEAWMDKVPSKATDTVRAADGSGETAVRLLKTPPVKFSPSGYVLVGGKHG